MTQVDETCEQLIREIDRAFSDVTRENGTTLHEADLEGTGSEADRRRARERDQESRWQDVPDDVIAKHHSILSFLDAKGFRYYLPAYMTFALRHFRDSDSPSVDFAIYALCHVDGDGVDSGLGNMDKIFSEQQLHSISRFLRFMAECTDGHGDDLCASEALKKYWGRFFQH